MVVNAQTIKNGLKISTHALIKAAPTIGVIFGTGLMAGSTVVTGLNAPELRDELEALDADETLSHKEYLRKKLKILVKYLGWPVAMSVFGAGLIFGGYKIKCTQAMVATAALAAKTDEAEKLQKKVLEKYGPKEYEKIQEEIIKDDVNAHPINFANVINTGHGNTLCYDPVFHDYFWSDLDYIRKQARDINKDTLTKNCRYGRKSAVSYNTWREYLDLPSSRENENDDRDNNVGNIENFGKDIGWLNREIELKITVFNLSDDSIVHVIGFTAPGGPRWFFNADDQDGAELETDANGKLIDDDETDMKWR